MKKFFKNIHLWLSIPTGILISVICLSGAALVFEQDITQWLNPHLYQTKTCGNEKALKPSVLAAHVRQQMPDLQPITSLQMPGTPDGVCMVSIKGSGKKTLSVNPYTGQINGWTKSYPFFQHMRKLHRWFMDPPPQKGAKSAGKILVGICTLLMTAILLTGLVIWIPRTGKALKNRLKISFTKGWRRFCYDSHIALGFYATIFLLVMALTGLTWSFGWYRNAAYALFGGKTQSHPTHQDNRNAKQQKDIRHISADFKIWDTVFAKLQTRYPEYKTITLSAGEAQIEPDRKDFTSRKDKITFDTRTGEVKEIIPYHQMPRSQTLKGWFYALHTGSWGGMITKVLYFIAALIGGILPLSGYYIWLKRKRYI